MTAVMFGQVFFNEQLLRKRFKIDQPHSLRVSGAGWAVGGWPFG